MIKMKTKLFTAASTLLLVLLFALPAHALRPCFTQYFYDITDCDDAYSYTCGWAGYLVCRYYRDQGLYECKSDAKAEFDQCEEDYAEEQAQHEEEERQDEELELEDYYDDSNSD